MEEKLHNPIWEVSADPLDIWIETPYKYQTKGQPISWSQNEMPRSKDGLNFTLSRAWKNVRVPASSAWKLMLNKRVQYLTWRELAQDSKFLLFKDWCWGHDHRLWGKVQSALSHRVIVVHAIWGGIIPRYTRRWFWFSLKFKESSWTGSHPWLAVYFSCLISRSSTPYSCLMWLQYF